MWASEHWTALPTEAWTILGRREKPGETGVHTYVLRKRNQRTGRLYMFSEKAVSPKNAIERLI